MVEGGGVPMAAAYLWPAGPPASARSLEARPDALQARAGRLGRLLRSSNPLGQAAGRPTQRGWVRPQRPTRWVRPHLPLARFDCGC
jgi:hypothetical protein